MSRGILNSLVLYVCIFSLLGANDLTQQYREKMGIASTNTNKSTIVKTTKDDIVSDIRKIKNMKRSTFESSRDFDVKRNSKIVELKNKTKFFARTGEKKFSFGTVKMKSYNPDSEQMILRVTWHNNIYSIFPELKKVRTVYLNIPRKEAKNLFEKKRIHYFHAEIGYMNENLVVTNMLLYNKYSFYENTKRKFTTKPDTALSCKYYYGNAASVNVRSRPSVNSKKMSLKLNVNNRVCVTQKNGSWSYIENRGWVLSRFLQKEKVKKVRHTKRQDRSLWHCIAKSTRVTGWVDRVGKENAKRGAIRQCTKRMQTRVPCKITNCYRL